MRLYFLGTASGLPTPVRMGQTTVLEIDGDLHILDAGDGASSLLARSGLSHLAVRSVTISHMHGDHHCGLVQLIKTMMHLKKKDPLIVYLPEEGIPALQAILEASYIVPEWLGYPIHWIPIDPHRPISLAPGVEIRAVANEHLANTRVKAQELARIPSGWRYQSYSFLLGAKGLEFAYSGNLKSSLKEMHPFAAGVDVLISELAHIAPEDAYEALEILRPRHAFFAHFHRVWDDKRNWEQGGLTRLAQGLDGVSVWIASDGDVYDIDDTGRVSRAG